MTPEKPSNDPKKPKRKKKAKERAKERGIFLRRRVIWSERKAKKAKE